jgi:PEGA domain
MKRRVHALACACCLSCLTAAVATAQSARDGSRGTPPARPTNHHRTAAPPRRAHPKPAPRVLAASRRLAPFVGVRCFAVDDAAADPSCSEESTAGASGDLSTLAPPDIAPSQVVPNVPGPAAAQPSSIQPQPPSLLPPPPGSANGTLRLDVEPQSTQVFVDGFYAGSVAEINERGLAVGAGWHRLVFRSPGYETVSANVTVGPNRTTTYHLAWRPAP